MTESEEGKKAGKAAKIQAIRLAQGVTATSSGPDGPEGPGPLKKVAVPLDIIVKLAVLATFAVAYFEYSGAQDARRVEASFALVTNWEKDGYQKAYQDLVVRINRMRAQFANDFPDQKNDPAFERTYISGELIKESKSDETARSEINRIFYFFGKAGLCDAENICDGRVLSSFFGDSASDFMYYLLPYAQLQQSKGKNQYGKFAIQFSEKER